MFTSNLKSLPMKKQWKHLVVKLFTILWISPASTSCPGFGMRNLEEIGSSIITDDSLAFLDGVVCRLAEGVGVSLSDSVFEGVVRFQTADTNCGFLTNWGLDDPAPSLEVVFCITGSWYLVLPYKPLFSTVIACLNFVNQAWDLCVRCTAIDKYWLQFDHVWLNARLFCVECIERLRELVHEHMNILHSANLKDDIHVVSKSLNRFTVRVAHVCFSTVSTFTKNIILYCEPLTTWIDQAITSPSLGTYESSCGVLCSYHNTSGASMNHLSQGLFFGAMSKERSNNVSFGRSTQTFSKWREVTWCKGNIMDWCIDFGGLCIIICEHHLCGDMVLMLI